MAQSVPIVSASENSPKIATFAVLDLETTNLPAYNNNRVGITELCIYAFDADLLKDNTQDNDASQPRALPTSPRVMHKLNLLFQPSMMVHPEAEKATGLSNYLLERESKLNENSAHTILGFLKHLPAPVCLVAHNGWYFDFPIVKQAFAKLNLELPSGITCVDSLRAFLEIDDKRKSPEPKLGSTTPETAELAPTEVESQKSIKQESEASPKKEINWQAINETTPQRAKPPPAEAALKRKEMADPSDYDRTSPPVKQNPKDFNSRRQLFTNLNCSKTKRFPPRLLYRLGNLYERELKTEPVNAHRAEADVDMLTQLMQHYGADFLAFAEEQAIPFTEVVPLGGKAAACCTI
ncbi:three prime repair exonuclease 2 [Scaptodrosophila lebanonensis]|uniref:Three prime repair exonuclease 2 n=1 Tax=Drosophila lebanonensis TaxID=7225 RepID=A0A6J2TK53_DROLE|nr:three prime repair exonuclease 2 [Scaptodrosophila lebanonensis]